MKKVNQRECFLSTSEHALNLNIRCNGSRLLTSRWTKVEDRFSIDPLAVRFDEPNFKCDICGEDKALDYACFIRGLELLSFLKPHKGLPGYEGELRKADGLRPYVDSCLFESRDHIQNLIRDQGGDVFTHFERLLLIIKFSITIINNERDHP